MPYALFVDSSNSISFDPEYDFKDEGEKIEDVHRVRSGEQYRYKWGSYDRFSFSVMYVNSSTKSIVNSWWLSNTDLLFMEEGGTDVFSVHLANGKKPIDAVIAPYDDTFKGKIELETY